MLAKTALHSWPASLDTMERVLGREMTYPDAAKRFGVDSKTFFNALAKARATAGREPRNKTEAVLAAFAAGKRNRYEIAREVGCTVAFVAAMASREGVKLLRYVDTPKGRPEPVKKREEAPADLAWLDAILASDASAEEKLDQIAQERYLQTQIDLLSTQEQAIVLRLPPEMRQAAIVSLLRA